MILQYILYNLKVDETTFQISHERKAVQKTARPQRVWPKMWQTYTRTLLRLRKRSHSIWGERERAEICGILWRESDICDSCVTGGGRKVPHLAWHTLRTVAWDRQPVFEPGWISSATSLHSSVVHITKRNWSRSAVKPSKSSQKTKWTMYNRSWKSLLNYSIHTIEHG